MLFVQMTGKRKLNSINNRVTGIGIKEACALSYSWSCLRLRVAFSSDWESFSLRADQGFSLSFIL